MGCHTPALRESHQYYCSVLRPLQAAFSVSLVEHSRRLKVPSYESHHARGLGGNGDHTPGFRSWCCHLCVSEALRVSFVTCEFCLLERVFHGFEWSTRCHVPHRAPSRGQEGALKDAQRPTCSSTMNLNQNIRHETHQEQRTRKVQQSRVSSFQGRTPDLSRAHFIFVPNIRDCHSRLQGKF